MAVKTCRNCGLPVVTGHTYGAPDTVPATKCPQCRAEARASGSADVAGLPGVVATGGGWYELPGGERVHGRAKALEALARAGDYVAGTVTGTTEVELTPGEVLRTVLEEGTGYVESGPIVELGSDSDES